MAENRFGMWKFIPPRERLRLSLMLVALIVLTASMFLIVEVAKRKAPAEVPHGQRGAESTAQPPAAPPAADESVEPGEGPEMAESGQPDSADVPDIYDPEILKEVQDNTSTVAKEGLVLLLHNLQGKTQDDVVAGTNTRVFLDDLYKEPAAHRGELVYVDGIVSKLHNINIGANSTGIDTLYFGHMSRPGTPTRTICFYLLDGPLGMKPGDHVQLHGYFLSLWKHMEEGDEGISPIIVGRRFDPPDWLIDSSVLDQVDEGGFLKENRPIYYAMNKMLKMTAAEAAQAVDKTVKPSDLETDPVRLRGKHVRFIGAIARLNRTTDPNPTGLTEYFTGYLVNKEKNTCFFYIIDLPRNVKETDLVALDGIFIKNYRYVNQRSLETEASIIVGRTLAPVTTDSSPVYILILGVCGAAFVVIAIAAAFETRSLKKQNEERRRRTFSHAPPNISAKAREAARKARGG
ncbi:MAG TPA: hypothetical protein VM186_04870 [Planctomycetota bacterium]|nr:hypothetical protein [Planctomycetota bacterium]